MVKCIHTLRLCKAIFNVLLNIETIHKDKGGRLSFIEQLLLKTVAVLSIVYKNFAVCCGDQPFVIRFQETDVKGLNRYI